MKITRKVLFLYWFIPVAVLMTALAFLGLIPVRWAAAIAVLAFVFNILSRSLDKPSIDGLFGTDIVHGLSEVREHFLSTNEKSKGVVEDGSVGSSQTASRKTKGEQDPDSGPR